MLLPVKKRWAELGVSRFESITPLFMKGKAVGWVGNGDKWGLFQNR